MNTKSKGILVLLGISAVISVAAGVYILMNPWDMTATQQALIGITSLIGGIIFAGYPKRSWLGVLALIIFGLYQLGRASGIIEHQLFKYFTGLPLIALGLYAIYTILVFMFPSEGKD